MNWLERARREISESARSLTANSAERDATAVTAVADSAHLGEWGASNGSNGSAVSASMLKTESLREDFEERAAIMEYDGGLSRDEAERAALAQVLNRFRLH